MSYWRHPHDIIALVTGLMIKTSSWFVTLPSGHARIGISRGTPRGQRGFRRYTALNPGPWFHSCSTPMEYAVRYYREVLAPLDPEKVVNDLIEIADNDIPVLLCFEAPPPSGAWCHRGLVSGWLHDELGIEVTELGHEAEGFGWAHPKLRLS
jgi:hypothetical protein